MRNSSELLAFSIDFLLELRWPKRGNGCVLLDLRVSKTNHDSDGRPSVLIVSGCASHPAEGGNRKRLLNLSVALREIGWKPVLLYTDFLPGDMPVMRQWWGKDHYFQAYRPGSSKWMLKRLARRVVPEHGWLRSLHRSKLYNWGSGNPQQDALTARTSVDTYYEPALDSVIDRLQAQYRFRAVIAQFVIMSRALLRFQNGVKKLIDTHEIFALGDAWKTAAPAKLWLRISPQEELMALNRADTALAIQKHDAETMRKAGVRDAKVFGHPVEMTPNLKFEAGLASKTILFISRGHPFDISGLEWFAKAVFPLMASWLKPEQVVVAGMIKHVMVDRPPFNFLGRVPDLAAVYANTRAVIAPLHEGTGLKIKVVEALGFGRALVATPFAALGVEDGVNTAFAVASSPAEFAASLKRVMQDDAECRRLMEGAAEYAGRWNRAQAAALKAAVES
jgi:glycosyltransferase involved in cell wall biosynthesis